MSAPHGTSRAAHPFLVGDQVTIGATRPVWTVAWVSDTAVELHHSGSRARCWFHSITDDASEHTDRLRPVHRGNDLLSLLGGEVA